MYKIITSIVLSSFLIACGGGGDSGTNAPVVTPTPTPEPPVQETKDHSGLVPLTAESIDQKEYLSGGNATLFLSNKDAFSTRPEMIASNFAHDANFTSGDHLFRTPDADIGPLLSTSSCQGCHLNDGRGVVPATPTTPMTSMALKVGGADGKADPIYGGHIQPFAVQGFTTSDFDSGLPKHDGSVNGDALFGEAFPFVEYEVVDGTYPDGTAYQLRKPIYKVKDLSFGSFVEDVRFSARVAPQVFGTGLLEAIPQDNILALVDENDANNDGISGRAMMVTDKNSGQIMLGRFAYKAQSPTLLHQVAGAYLADMGVTTSVFPNENCTAQQPACWAAAGKEKKVADDVDLADLELAQVEFYNRTLGVPARRGYNPDNQTWNQDVRAGRKTFFQLNCSGCHTPRHVTGVAKGSQLGEISLVGLEPNPAPIEMLSNQTIFPYTDLLVHDMGGSCVVTREDNQGVACTDGASCFYVQRCEGLADTFVQGDASGTEWKTPALWGIGLVQTVNANSTFLHDGRARTIEEAILWHGGEAEQIKQAFMALPQAQRAQLLAFLKSL